MKLVGNYRRTLIMACIHLLLQCSQFSSYALKTTLEKGVTDRKCHHIKTCSKVVALFILKASVEKDLSKEILNSDLN